MTLQGVALVEGPSEAQGSLPLGFIYVGTSRGQSPAAARAAWTMAFMFSAGVSRGFISPVQKT